jgi:hypothetical protein
MGRIRVEEMIAFVGRDAALADHLASNLFPPPGEEFTEACKDALAAVDAGDVEHRVLLPNGREVSAAAVVEGLHLEAFLTPDDSEI